MELNRLIFRRQRQREDNPCFTDQGCFRALFSVGTACFIFVVFVLLSDEVMWEKFTAVNGLLSQNHMSEGTNSEIEETKALLKIAHWQGNIAVLQSHLQALESNMTSASNNLNTNLETKNVNESKRPPYPKPWNPPLEPYGNCMPLNNLSPIDGTDTSLIPKFFPTFLRSFHAPLGKDISDTGGFVNASRSSFDRWHAILDAITHKQKKTLKIVLLGGSLASGEFPWNLPWNADPYLGAPYSNRGLQCEGQCHTHTFLDNNMTFVWNGDFGQGDCSECSFIRRWVDWLQRAYPDVEITYQNLAIAGQPNAGALGRYGHELANLVDVDFVVIGYTFNDWAAAESVGDVEIGASFEQLLITIMESEASPQILIYEYNGQLIDPAQHFVYIPHVAIANHYKIPVVSYDLSCISLPDEERKTHDPPYPTLPPLPPNTSSNGKWSPINFYGQVHPHWPHHQFMADLLSYSWWWVANQFCNSSESHSHSHTHIHTHTHIKPIPELSEARLKFQQCFNSLTSVTTQDGHESIMFGSKMNQQDEPLASSTDFPLLADVLTTSTNGSMGGRPFDKSILPTINMTALQQGNTAIQQFNGTKSDFFASNIYNSTWTFGEDVPGNRKYGWFLDSSTYGGRLTFKVYMKKKDPRIIFSYLESYTHKIAPVYLYLGNDFSRIIVINSFSDKHKSSQTRTVPLCWDDPANSTLSGGDDRNNDYSFAAAKAYLSSPHHSKNRRLRHSMRILSDNEDASGGPSSSHLPTCVHNVAAPAHTSTKEQFKAPSYDDAVETLLNIEMLPSGDPSIKSKFKLISIATC